MKNIKIRDISSPVEQLAEIKLEELYPLPPPYDKIEEQPGFKNLSPEIRAKYEASLDGVMAVGLKKPESEEEEKKLIDAFISGLNKLFTKENNWTFLQPLTLSMEYCARCQTCNMDCPIYVGSGMKEIYRPTYRSEVLRRLYFKYVKKGSKIYKSFQNGGIELNWELIARLFELSYRCTLCRRCAQSCPIGVDNGLITHELRKMFSMEMGLSPKELHEKGTVQQLEVGSSTGMNALVVKDNMEFIDEDISERTGIKVESKWDVEGAEILLIHNSGEILTWPENPGAFALILDAAGIKWTLSSDLVGYDGVNYGLFYDDVQLARVAMKHLEIAKKLKVKKIVMGECGHESKAMGVIADRIFEGAVPRETAMTLMNDIVFSGKIKLNPERNWFPVTLHDPCNLTRSMGVIEPQRKVLRYIAPKFREMEPHGVRNYCCGGGSGFAVMSAYNFSDWRIQVASRMKFEQVLNAFADESPGPETPKYVCAPCSNCKGAFRDMFDFYGAKTKSGLYYAGLVELIVNAMVDVNEGFIDFDMM
ncbi:MAG: 4Fe-4S ferredoxin [Ignavibacteria bacterium GWB2_35_12]|nr:MAG: 4Fe-4S ferredoxin [Ignavibacteria bacterium GWB2_35_12]OGU89115.1 MAG: 4Fe-4S ferredoxin [Ignavibacteria bacterium RIFOXYA2_FULL_35_10]OGV23098.1 MAG: 4Fe-4S ferredoxin [Ignavibacteria bacterium RIFOXYC2_FULL_35_21]